MRNIVLHIPHSSNTNLKNSTPWEGGDITIAKNQWVDWFTDELFAPSDNQNWVKSVVFPYCRFDCDAERLWSDPMESKGQGIVYEKFRMPSKGLFFQRNVDDLHRIEAMLEYSNYKLKLINTLTQDCLVIDCHSFPSSQSEDVDICIGYNEDWSKPDSDTLKFIINHFKKAGYRVGVNKPYSNSISPLCRVKYHSVMIEVNKKLYMNEDTLSWNKESKKIKYFIRRLYDEINKRPANNKLTSPDVIKNKESHNKEEDGISECFFSTEIVSKRNKTDLFVREHLSRGDKSYCKVYYKSSTQPKGREYLVEMFSSQAVAMHTKIHCIIINGKPYLDVKKHLKSIYGINQLKEYKVVSVVQEDKCYIAKVRDEKYGIEHNLRTTNYIAKNTIIKCKCEGYNEMAVRIEDYIALSFNKHKLVGASTLFNKLVSYGAHPSGRVAICDMCGTLCDYKMSYRINNTDLHLCKKCYNKIKPKRKTGWNRIISTPMK